MMEAPSRGKENVYNSCATITRNILVSISALSFFLPSFSPLYMFIIYFVYLHKLSRRDVETFYEPMMGW